jgi:hypothetical protein
MSLRYSRRIAVIPQPRAPPGRRIQPCALFNQTPSGGMPQLQKIPPEGGTTKLLFSLSDYRDLKERYK